MSGVPEKLARTILDLIKKAIEDGAIKIDLRNVKGTLGTGHGGTGGAAGATGPPGPDGAPGADATPLTGDVTTSGHAATVERLRSLPITTAAPTVGEFLMWDGSLLVWRPATVTTPDAGVTEGGTLVVDGGVYVIET